ncbi:MAG: hypothetical protein IJ538_04030 [Clostridia bacterium]|nr:hypothetical protein [Clostridia bacterium]
MKKERTLNILSLIFNFAIVLITINSIAYAFRTDIIRQNSYFEFDGFLSLRFFTNLSNILVAITSICVLIFNIKNAVRDEFKLPRWAVIFKFVGTVAVTVTFLTVACFLSPGIAFNGGNYFILFKGNSFFLHFLTPVLAIISFVFFEKTEKFSFRFVFLALIPILVYGIVYFVMVVIVQGWPDFYNLTFGGKNWMAPISAIMMLLATFAFASLEWLSQKKWIEKQNKKAG